VVSEKKIEMQKLTDNDDNNIQRCPTQSDDNTSYYTYKCTMVPQGQ